MNYFDRMLLSFLSRSKITMEVSGFDLEGVQRTLYDEWKKRLEAIEYVVFEDSDIMSDAEKITIIKTLFEQEFYDKE